MENETDPCKPEQFSDPDVTGIGVLIALGTSILLTIGSILAAYILGALRHDRYNSADKALLDLIYRTSRPRRTWGNDERINRPKQVVAFETFIQAMADQNLFTGLALIVAVYLIRYGATGLDVDVSTYSFCVAVNLALLSCITHLSAMTVLRTYYSNYKLLRNIRVAMMVVAIALTLPQLVASQVLETSITLRCALYDSSHDPFLIWSDYHYDQTVFFATLAAVGALVCGYLRRLLELYSLTFRASPEVWVAEGLGHIFGWPTANAREKYATEAARHEAALASRLANSENVGMKLILGVVASALNDSFFAEIIWLLFYFVFAVTNIIFFFLWGPSPDSKDDSTISLSMGFGQILPLVLLGLPFLSALELSAVMAIAIQEDGPKGRLNGDRNQNDELETFIPVQTTSGTMPDFSSHIQPDTHTSSHSDMFEVCMQNHPKITKGATLILMVSYTVIVALAALILTGIAWSGYTQEDSGPRIWTGYALTIVVFICFALALVVALFNSVRWIWRGRYSRSLRPSQH